MKKSRGAAMTIAAICMCGTLMLTGCSFTELFVGTDGAASGTSADASTGTAVYVSGQAVEIEDYDAREYVKLAQYKGVEMDCTVTDEEVQDEINTLLEANPKKVKKGTAENGMTVNIDYSGKMNGKKFEGGTAEGTTITLGESGMIPGFDDGIIGMKVGETKDVDLTFPDDYHSEDLAGKKAVFTMKLNYIEEKPEFNDEFVKENSDYQTVAEFKEGKKKELGDAKEQAARASGAMEKVVSESEVSSVPDSLLLAEKEMMRAQTENQMSMYGMTLEDALAQQNMTLEDFEQYLEGNARSMAESELIMEAIAIEENMDLSQTAVDTYIDEMLQKSAANSEDGQPMSREELETNYKNIYGSAMPMERYMRSSMIYSKVSELVGNEAKIIR